MTNPKHLSIRTDPKNGDMWLVDQRPNDPRVRRVKDVTQDVLMALCADAIAMEGTRSLSRDVRFSDGVVFRIVVEEVLDAG